MQLTWTCTFVTPRAATLDQATTLVTSEQRRHLVTIMNSLQHQNVYIHMPSNQPEVVPRSTFLAIRRKFLSAPPQPILATPTTVQARYCPLRLHLVNSHSVCSLGHERRIRRLVSAQPTEKRQGFAAGGARQGQPCAHSNPHRLRAATRRKVSRPILRNPCQSFSPPATRFGIDGVSFRQVEQPLCFYVAASSC